MFVCLLLEKAVPEMTSTVSGGTLNPTHSLTHPCDGQTYGQTERIVVAKTH